MTDFLGRQILSAAYRDRQTNTMVIRMDDVVRAFCKTAAKFGKERLSFPVPEDEEAQ